MVSVPGIDGARPSKALLFLGLLFALFGTIGAVGGVGAYLTDSAIVRSGARTQARVTDKSFLFDTEGDSEYRIDYEFELRDGASQRGRHGIPKERWEALEEGDAITVLYSPDRPSRNFPEGGGVTSFALTVFLSLFAAAFAAFGGLLVASYCSAVRSASRRR